MQKLRLLSRHQSDRGDRVTGGSGQGPRRATFFPRLTLSFQRSCQQLAARSCTSQSDSNFLSSAMPTRRCQAPNSWRRMENVSFNIPLEARGRIEYVDLMSLYIAVGEAPPRPTLSQLLSFTSTMPHHLEICHGLYKCSLLLSHSSLQS